MLFKKSSLYFTGITLLVAANAHAGPGASGGGSFYHRLDGSLDMADMIAVEPDTDQEYHLSKDAVEYLSAIKNLLSDYGIESEDFWNLVFSRKAEYQYAKGELPCKERFPVNDQNAELDQYACTKGGVTYLNHAKFDSAPFPLKMLGLFHERLHAFAPEVSIENHYWITNVVAATETLITLLNEQRNGSTRDLTATELAIVQKMYRRADQLGFKVSTSGSIIQSGGGYQLDPYSTVKNSFVGVGSILSNSQISNSQISFSRIDKSDIDFTKVTDSSLKFTSIKNSTILKSSVLKFYDGGTAKITNVINSNFVNSIVEEVENATNSNFTESNVEAKNITAALIQKSTVRSINLDDAQITNCNLQTENFIRSKCINSSFLLGKYGNNFNDSQLIDSVVTSKWLRFGVATTKFSNVIIKNLNVEIGLNKNAEKYIYAVFENSTLDFKKFGTWRFIPQVRFWIGGGQDGPTKHFSTVESFYRYHE